MSINTRIDIWAKYMALKRVALHHTIPRVMGSVKDLTALCMTYSVVFHWKKKRKWPQHLPQLLFAYNTTEHASTGFTPYELIFGQKAKLPLDFLPFTSDTDLDPGSTHDWVVEHQRWLQTAYHHTKEQLRLSAERRNRQLIPNVTDVLPPGILVF